MGEDRQKSPPVSERPALTPAKQYQVLAGRVERETGWIENLLERMSSMNREFTEADMNDLNALKQSVLACQRVMDQYKEQSTAELFPTPRPQVLQSSITQARTSPARDLSRRKHPAGLVRGRGRSMRSDKRRRSDQGERGAATRQRFDPVTVQPPITIPRPTVASLFTGGADELSSSCPTAQEPSHPVTIPQVFQTAGAAMQLSGSMYPSQVQRRAQNATDPPRDPRAQSERRVNIQTPS